MAINDEDHAKIVPKIQVFIVVNDTDGNTNTYSALFEARHFGHGVKIDNEPIYSDPPPSQLLVKPTLLSEEITITIKGSPIKFGGDATSLMVDFAK